jgi:hypothetical protein
MTVLPLGRDGPDRGPELAPALDVDGRGGLVEHEQVGVGHQGDREADPLGLAAGELVGASFGELGHSGQLHRVLDRERPGVDRGDHRDQLAHAQVLDQCPGLQHAADGAGRDRLGGRLPEQRHRAGIRPGQAEHHLDRGGLAGAVRAEDGDGLTGGDGQVDRTDGVDVAVRLGQAREHDPRAGSVGSSHDTTVARRASGL